MKLAQQEDCCVCGGRGQEARGGESDGFSRGVGYLQDAMRAIGREAKRRLKGPFRKFRCQIMPMRMGRV